MNESTRHLCPKCHRKLRYANVWHYCKEVEIDNLFIDKSDSIVLAFNGILQQVALWEDVDVSGTKNCVVFVRNKTFLVIKPMSKWLEVKFYSESIIDDDMIIKNVFWSGKYNCIIRLGSEDHIKSSLFDYIKASYQIS